MIEVTVYVGLGANLGDVRSTLDAAYADLRRLPGTHGHRCSPWFKSRPVDASGPDFLNAVACFDSSLSPHSVLAELHRIEELHGRERPYRNSPRTLDLDLLLHGQVVMNSADLTIPHPRLQERAFVLLPLAALAPDLVIPGRGAIRLLLPAVSGQVIEQVC